MKKFSSALLLTVALAALVLLGLGATACGKKGDLTLPKAQASASAPR